MKCLFVAVFLHCLSIPAAPARPVPPDSRFAVSPSGRHLLVDGQPFFWLGDTVWLLGQLPSRDEVELYLKTRVEQGFSLIQLTAVMGEERVWGTLRPNSYGDLPFVNADVAQPAVTAGNDPADAQAYDYWDNLDWVIDRVHAHGLRAALVTYFVGSRGEGYRFLQPHDAFGYGQFLGARYRTRPDLVWLLGGDNVPDTPEKKATWNAVARGIATGLSGTEDYARVLMTYHISGGSSSSQFWHDSPWLDFNMAQTWSEYREIYPAVLRDYLKAPAKPCGLGEGAYEDGPQYPTGPINALVVRQQACWSYFAGGYHTYGNGNVWHFDSYKGESTQPWKDALRSPGAESLRHIQRFLQRFEWWNCIPDKSVLSAGESPDTGDASPVALRNSGTGSIAVYLGQRNPIKLRLGPPERKFRAVWFNPATGQEQAFEITDTTQPITPPPGWPDALFHCSPVPGAN